MQQLPSDCTTRPACVKLHRANTASPPQRSAARHAPQQDGVRVTRPLGLLAERRKEQLRTAGILCAARGSTHVS